MYLCCVETLSSFQSKLVFYEFLKLLKNQAKVPVLCTRSLAKFRQKWLGENSPFL